MALVLVACATPTAPRQTSQPGAASLNVLAVETFLADIAQHVAGDRFKIAALMPYGVDPHGFEPTPDDVARIAASDVLIVNGAGFEAFLSETLENAGGQRQVIEASAGMKRRMAQAEEAVGDAQEDSHVEDEGDPHFWLDPLNVVKYVENIRDGLSKADPAGAATYKANSEVYINRLNEQDRWVSEQVQQIPAERRILVTNHESFGYFADRYGFKIVGAIVPSVSASAAPSAQQLARLIDQITATGAPAIFLETGANAQLAEQVARETGVKVVAGLYTHSTSEPSGPAPDYIGMIRYNTTAIVDALR
jgi:ABC-type Zn uptake system ZnuABC Zn-binding protein ZnuA